MAQFALRWILAQPAVSVAIPGARNATQAQGNAAASDVAAPTQEQLAAISEIYDALTRIRVHDRW